MRLHRLFFLISLGMALVVIAATASIVTNAWLELRHAVKGIEAMEQLRAVLVTAEMASAERGPSNGLMGSAVQNDPIQLKYLHAARQRTDAAFEGLFQILDAASASGATIRPVAERAREQLRRGRERVDEQARQRRDDRSTASLRQAIDEMSKVINEITPAMTKLTIAASTSFPEATYALIAARQSAQLRELAGQLGSKFAAPLTTRKRLDAEEHIAIERLRGRIEQLGQQLASDTLAVDAPPRVQAAASAMSQQYFASALPFVDKLTEIGLRDGRYGLSAAAAVARYVPDMGSIVALRDALLDSALDDAQQRMVRLRELALRSAAGSALMLTLLALTWWLLHRRVVLALTRTTELIVTLARGHLDVEVPQPKYRDEVGDMLNAIAVLRDNSIARQTAENAIRKMAYYDRLTGLPNRRLLEDRMQQVLAGAQRRHTKVAAMFVDLDQFKQVNDQHGHNTGDSLLLQVAQRMRSVLRESDTAARVGGDEFVVVLPDIDEALDAALVAEKIRQQMEQPFLMSDGTQLHISSSIGVAIYPDHADNPRDLLHWADEAMYKAKKGGRNAVEVFGSDNFIKH